MKIKLLKKLKKRYSWYFNKTKYPVLIDHLLKKAIVYDLEYCLEKDNFKIEELKCEHTEYALRILKKDILTKYGWNYGERVNRFSYNKANSIYNKKLNHE
jgi:hypothetical protein